MFSNGVSDIVNQANAAALTGQTASKVLTNNGICDSDAASSTVKDLARMSKKLPSESLQRQISSAALRNNNPIDQLRGLFEELLMTSASHFH